MRLAEGVATAPFADGAVIHDSRNGRIYQLNRTAGQALQLLRTGTSPAAIACLVATEVGLDQSRVARDLESCVVKLRDAGLLHRKPSRNELPAAGPPPARPALDAVYNLVDTPVRVVAYASGLARAFAALAGPAEVPGIHASAVRIDVYRCGAYFLLRSSAGRTILAPRAPEARWLLLQEVVRTSSMAWLCLLHASAVSSSTGSVVIAGPSGAGKTTLQAALVHAGFAFLADDLVPLESGSWRVWPVRTATSFKVGSWPMVTKLFPDLLAAPLIRFGGRTMRYLWLGGFLDGHEPTPVPVKVLLFPRYRESAATALVRLGLESALKRLGESSSVLPGTDAAFAQMLDWLRSVPSFELTYGRLDEAITQIRSLVDAV